MDTKTINAPVTEHEELVEMRTHLTVAMLAAAQLRRATNAVPEAAHFDAYLQQALDSLRDDVRNVETLVSNAESESEPRCARTTGSVCPKQAVPRRRRLPLPLRLPVVLARHVAGYVAQRIGRRVTRLRLLTASY